MNKPDHLVKKTWLDIALEVYRFHLLQCRTDPRWTVRSTAISLNRSLGSISQYITIGDWYKTHEKQLKRCRSMRDALDFIDKKKQEMRFSGLES